LPLCLAFVNSGQAAIETSHSSITVGRGRYLAVEGGKLVIRNRPSKSDETRAAPERWVVDRGRIRSSTDGTFLTYDPSDKKGKVFLAARPVKGAEWVVTRGRGEPKNTRLGSDRGEWGLVKAGSGPMKGWYLDAEGDDPVGLVLREKPKCDVEVARLYTHR